MEKPAQNCMPPSCDELAEAISDAFAACVGLGKNKTSVADLAVAVGCCPSTIYQLKSGELKPSSVLLLQCGATLGPPFLNLIASKLGMGGLYRLTGENIAIMAHGARLSDSSADIFRASSDGRIDHREAAEIAVRLRTDATEALELADQLESVARKGGSIPSINPVVTPRPNRKG